MAIRVPGSSTSVVTVNDARTMTVQTIGHDQQPAVGAGLVPDPEVAER